MKKSLIAVAVTCALASMSALADDGNVSIYGKADLAVGNVSNGDVSTTRVTSQITKIGFMGSEDVGNGTAAIWQIEQQVDIDNAGGVNSPHTTFAGRNSFLGLKNNGMGTFLLGRHDSPYKLSTRFYDPFNDQFADNRHLMGGGIGANSAAYMDMRPGDAVEYISPNFGGITVSAQYVLGGEGAKASTDKQGNMTSLALNYSQGKEGLQAALAIQNVKFGTVGQFTAPNAVGAGGMAADDTYKGTRLGVEYKTSQFIVAGVYEKLTSSVATPDVGFTANEYGRTNINLSGQFNISDMDNVQLGYTKAGNTDNLSSTGATELSLGYNHYLSKKTNVYIQYAKISNNQFANYQFNGASTNAITNGTANTVGKSPSGILLGMRKNF